MRRGPKLDTRMIIGGVVALIVVVGILAALGGGGDLFGTGGRNRDRNNNDQNNNQGGGDQNQGGGDQNQGGGNQEQPPQEQQPQQQQPQEQQPQEQQPQEQQPQEQQPQEQQPQEQQPQEQQPQEQQPQEQQPQEQQPQEQQPQEQQPTAVPVQPTDVPVQPTDVPVQPTDVPVQPTEVPQVAVQATTEPTIAPTQRSGNTNQDGTRPDRSSLAVTASCDGGNAVFTVRNTGEAGRGNMVSATTYGIYNDNTNEQLSSGSIQINGGATTTISFPSNGIKLRYRGNQQTGHPGTGVYQADITCGSGGNVQPTTVSTTVPTQQVAVVSTTVPTTVPTIVATTEPTQQVAVEPTTVPTNEPTVVAAQPTTVPTESSGRGNQNNNNSERLTICHVTPAQGIILDNMPRSALNGHFDNNGNLHGSDFLITNDEDRARCEGIGREARPETTPDIRVSICHVTPAQGIVLDNMPRSSLNGHFDNNGNLHGEDFIITNDEDRARCEGTGRENEPETTPEERVSICHVTPAQGIVLDNMPRSSLNGHFDNNGNLHGSDFLISSDADRERCEGTVREPQPETTPEERVSICHVTPAQGIVLDNMPRSSLNGHFDNNGNLHGEDFIITSDADRERCEGTGREPQPETTPEERVSICHVTPAQGIVLDNMPRSSLNGHFDNNGNLHGEDFIITSDADRERCEGTGREPEPETTPEERVSICHVTPAQGIVLDNMPRSSLNGHFDNNGNLHGSDFLITSDADRERCEGTGREPEPETTPEERVSICHVNPARSIVLDNMPRSSLNGHFDNNGNLHGEDFLITNDEDRARCEGTVATPEPELPPPPAIAAVCVVDGNSYSVQVVDASEVANLLSGNPGSFVMGEEDSCEAPPVPPVVIAVCVVNSDGYNVVTVEANDATELVNANAGSYILTEENASCEAPPPPPAVVAVCRVEGESYSVEVVDASEVESLLNSSPDSFVLGEGQSCERFVSPPPPTVAAVCQVTDEGYSVVVIDGSEVESFLASNPNSYVMGEEDTCEAPPVPPVYVPVCQVDGESYSVTTVEIDAVASIIASYPASFVLEEGLSCEAPPAPPAEVAICRVDGESYSVEVLEASEAEAILSESVNSYLITETSPACEPPAINVPVCVVNGESYTVEVVDASRANEIVSSNPGSYVVGEESPACEPPVSFVPPAPIAALAQVCRVDGNNYNVVEVFVTGEEGDDLSGRLNSEVDAVVAQYPGSYAIANEAEAASCVPPMMPPPPAVAMVCKVDNGSYSVVTIDAETLNSTLSDFPGSYVMSEEASCEAPSVPPVTESFGLCVRTADTAYGLTGLTAEERDSILASNPESTVVENNDFSSCLPPAQPERTEAQICRIDGNRYMVEAIDSEAVASVLANYPGSFVLSDATDASSCKRPERPTEPETTTGEEPTPEPQPTDVPVVAVPEEPIAGWAAITVGGAVCEDWVLYHTNETGDWEVFRLGELPEGRTGDRNLSQGVDATDMAPVRSPDNQWIAFVSNRDGNWEIYVGAVDGSQQIRVTYNEATDLDPVWSPDGTKLAYESNIDGNWEVRLFDLITGQSTRLTNNEAEDINPYWHPDGTKLVFQSNRDGMSQLYLLDVATQEVSKLSDGTANDIDPQFSNDGTMLLFRSDRNGGSLEATNVFYMMADGTGITQVSDNGGNAMNAVWSPDDRLIAYQSNINAGINDIYVYELATSATRLVTNNTGDNEAIEDISPTWICESTTLVFASEAEGDYDIYFVPAEPIAADPVEMVNETAQTVDPDEAAPFTDVDPENSPAEENASRNNVLLPSTNGN